MKNIIYEVFDTDVYTKLGVFYSLDMAELFRAALIEKRQDKSEDYKIFKKVQRITCKNAGD